MVDVTDGVVVEVGSVVEVVVAVGTVVEVVVGAVVVVEGMNAPAGMISTPPIGKVR